MCFIRWERRGQHRGARCWASRSGSEERASWGWPEAKLHMIKIWSLGFRGDWGRRIQQADSGVGRRKGHLPNLQNPRALQSAWAGAGSQCDGLSLRPSRLPPRASPGLSAPRPGVRRRCGPGGATSRPATCLGPGLPVQRGEHVLRGTGDCVCLWTDILWEDRAEGKPRGPEAWESVREQCEASVITLIPGMKNGHSH